MASTQATPKWRISGDFSGNCSCDYMRCPCPTSNYMEQPSKGWCRLAIGFHIEEGLFGDLKLDGLNAMMVAHVPGKMNDGNWSLGMIVDDRATDEQQQALVAIFSGQAGGPMAVTAGWIGTFLGLEKKPIRFEKVGLKRIMEVPGMLDCEAVGTPGANADEPVYLENLLHPANTRMAVGKGVTYHLHAFGIDFDGNGENFGGYTTFDWRSDSDRSWRSWS